VHRCIGADGRRDPARVARVLAELGADVVALQEVEAVRGGVDAIDQFAFLAASAGCAAVRGETLRSPASDYGNALLVRGRVLEAWRLDLSEPRREPRGALAADAVVRGARIRAVATHLGLERAERRAQVRRLLAWIDALPGADGALQLVMGDVNEWLPRAHSLRLLRARLGPSHAPRTFPARRPLLALDRIWATPPRALLRVAAHRTPLACAASDHLPLRAELRWPGDAGAAPAPEARRGRFQAVRRGREGS
jgi:endonuclease/exonuclease/phosphatase family metal-dependent hydrolase